MVTQRCLDPSDGRSLMSLARGEDDSISEAVGEYCAEMTGHPVFMIRGGDMKYIHCDSDPPQLFDIANDPWELTNLVNHASYITDNVIAGIKPARY